jgi:hypothetical protein
MRSKVRGSLSSSPPSLADRSVGSCPLRGGQGAYRAYLLWKARQVADQKGKEGGTGRAL